MSAEITIGRVERASWPSLRRAWFTVAVLTSAYVLSFIDRQILSLLAIPIKNDLGIGDVQLSLLQGLSFAVFYTLMGIPLGRLADTHNRRLIIVAGIVVWSAMTAACGVADSFWVLFAARVGVGIGEAALSPAALSIIADSFPREQLSRPCSVYMLGTVIGSGLALLLGGVLMDALEGVEHVVLPVFGSLRPWQFAFVAVGLPGILIAMLVLTVREPLRRVGQDARGPVSLRFFRRHWGVYAGLYLGYALIAIVIYAVLAWGPTFYARSFSLSLSAVGYRLGTVYLTASTVGMLCGGMFTAWLRARGREDASLLSVVIGAAVMLPSGLVAFGTNDAAVSMMLVAAFYFAASFPSGAVAAAVQEITPPRLRGVATGAFLFVINIIGLGMGPTLAAVITRSVFGDERRIGDALAVLAAIALPVAIVLLWTSRTRFRKLATL